jgi:hypothetical protein
MERSPRAFRGGFFLTFRCHDVYKKDAPMGQKTNPISLRLEYTNRRFESAWYSKYFYGQLLAQQLALQAYIDEFLKCMKLPRARTSVQYTPAGVSLYAFMCFPKKSRESNSRGLGLAPSRPRKPSRSRYSQVSRRLESSGLLWSNYWGHLSHGDQAAMSQSVAPGLYETGAEHHLDVTPMSWAPRAGLQGTPGHTDSVNPLQHMGVNVILGHHLQTSPSMSPSSGGDMSPWWHPVDTQVSSVLQGFLTHLYSGCRFPTSGYQSVSRQWSTFLHADAGMYPRRHGAVRMSQRDHGGAPGEMLTRPARNSPVSQKPVDMESIWQDSSGLLTGLYGHKGVSSQAGLQWHGAQGVFAPTLHAWLEKVEHRHKYRTLLQGHLSSVYDMPVRLWNLGVRQEWQGAGFLADEIAALLQQRVPFRRVKYRLLRACSEQPHIAGIRVQCSGRVGGKSKKAQRAKVESVTWGQTSLHVFSSRIDFAARTAQTALGSTGVKVWMCYK